MVPGAVRPDSHLPHKTLLRLQQHFRTQRCDMGNRQREPLSVQQSPDTTFGVLRQQHTQAAPDQGHLDQAVVEGLLQHQNAALQEPQLWHCGIRT